MGGYHMRVDLDGADADEATRRRASAFEQAFRHAATDPGMRAQMLVPECIRDLDHVLWEMDRKLQKESPEVRALVMRGLWERHQTLADLLREKQNATIRDLLLPGLVSVCNHIGLDKRDYDLAVVGAELCVVDRAGTTIYVLASAEELESGAYKDTFMARMALAMNDGKPREPDPA